VEAFNEMGHPLVMVGKGTEEKQLKKMARTNVVFKKDLSAGEIRGLYQDAAAYVFAGVEDFGITFVEAQACGIPVIAPKKGGVLDIVRDGETGILYQGEDVESIVDAVGKLQNFSFKPSVLRENSLKFSGKRFKAKIEKFIEEKL
jgi:glycosyltransferase involved in cell wall biosynthesis